jgi:hypothetical protein
MLQAIWQLTTFLKNLKPSQNFFPVCNELTLL